MLKKKNKVVGLTLLNFKTHFIKATVIKTVWYWQENRQINQGNRIESPEIDPCKYIQLNIFIEIRKEKVPQRSKDGLLQMALEQLEIHMQNIKNKKNLDTDLTLFTKIKSKWITDINVKCKTMKLLK